MLANLLIWVYIFGLSTVYGTLFIAWPFAARQSGRGSSVSWPVTILIGLALLTGIANLLSLVIKLGLIANLVMLALGLGLALLNRQELAGFLKEKWAEARRLHLASILLFGIIFIVVWAKSAQVPQNYDTGLYHAQAIHWIESFPAIPGLGVLQDRLAFDSSWLVTSALFSFAFLGIQSFHALGAFLVVVVAAYLVARFDCLWSGQIHLSALVGLIVLFLIRRIFPLEFSSPGTDMPAALLIWVIFVLALEKIEQGQSRVFDKRTLAIIVLTLYVLTIKLSVMPVVLLAIYFLIAEFKQLRWQSLAAMGGVALLIFVPWMGRNVILSGYLFYPVPQIDLFQVPWKISAEQARSAADIIRAWARVSANQTAVLTATLSAWLPTWYHLQDPADIQLLWMGAAGAIVLLGTALLALFKKQRSTGMAVYLVLVGITIAGLAYWFIEAPAMRFGYGFIGIFVGLAFAPLLQWLLAQKRLQRILLYVILAGFILYQGISLVNIVKSPGWRAQIVLPADYPQAPTTSKSIGNFTYYEPTHGDQCWYQSFPCVPSITAKPVMRDANIRDGFIEKP